MTKSRIKVLIYFLCGKNNGVRLRDLLELFFSTSARIKADKWIEKLEWGDEYNLVFIKNIKDPLYYPNCYPQSSLKQMIVELIYPNNWHYYEVP